MSTHAPSVGVDRRGLERFVKLDKGDFGGRAALVDQHERGVDRRLWPLVLDDCDALSYGDEAVVDDTGAIAYVMCEGYGPTVKATIALAYFPLARAQPGTELAVDLLGEQVRATLRSEPLFDPHNRLLRR
ncbi:MAG: glycine cleavage T C-terminal barrel domain-containing protein [Acidimicrobiales bacterium]